MNRKFRPSALFYLAHKRKIHVWILFYYWFPWRDFPILASCKGSSDSVPLSPWTPLLICPSKLIYKDWMFTWEASAVLTVTDNTDWLAYHSSSFQLLWLHLKNLSSESCNVGIFGGQTLNPINKLLLMLTDTIVWLTCLYSLHLVSTSPKAAVGAEGYEMTMLWGHTGAQACFVVVQECADERLKSKMQTHCFLQAPVFRSFPHSVRNCLPVCRVLVLIAVCHAIRHSVMPWLSMVLAFFSSFVFLSVFALLLNQLAQTWWFSSALVHTFPFPLRTPGTLFFKSWRWGVSEKGFELLSSLRLQVWNDVQVVMKETWGSDLIWDFNNLQYVSNHAI